MISATQIRVGNVLKIDGDLYRVLKIQHVTPGKGNAVVQTDLRNLRTGLKTNQRFRSVENVEKAEIFDRKMEFLYQDGATFHFMDPESYEQFEMTQDLLDEALHYLVPQSKITVSIHNGKAIGVSFPKQVTFKVVECDPASKGKAGGTKLAKIATGFEIKVPLFIKEGDLVVIDTETDSYVEKG